MRRRWPKRIYAYVFGCVDLCRRQLLLRLPYPPQPPGAPRSERPLSIRGSPPRSPAPSKRSGAAHSAGSPGQHPCPILAPAKQKPFLPSALFSASKDQPHSVRSTLTAPRQHDAPQKDYLQEVGGMNAELWRESPPPPKVEEHASQAQGNTASTTASVSSATVG